MMCREMFTVTGLLHSDSSRRGVIYPEELGQEEGANQNRTVNCAATRWLKSLDAEDWC